MTISYNILKNELFFNAAHLKKCQLFIFDRVRIVMVLDEPREAFAHNNPEDIKNYLVKGYCITRKEIGDFNLSRLKRILF
jgi:hypothetical protein